MYINSFVISLDNLLLRLFTLIYNAAWSNILFAPGEQMFSLKATAQTFSSLHNATPSKVPIRKIT